MYIVCFIRFRVCQTHTKRMAKRRLGHRDRLQTRERKREQRLERSRCLTLAAAWFGGRRRHLANESIIHMRLSLLAEKCGKEHRRALDAARARL